MSTVTPDLKNLTEFKAYDPLVKYTVLAIYPLILLIGLPGSIISFIVWTKRVPLVSASTNMLQMIVSLADVFAILQTGVQNLVDTQLDMCLKCLLGCKQFGFLAVFITDISSWMILLLCIERAICTWYPVQSKRVCCRRNGGIAIFTVFIFLFSANIPLLILSDNGNMNSCGFYEEYHDFYNYWHTIDLMLYSALPWLFIFILNVSIIYRLQRSHTTVDRKSYLNLPTSVKKPQSNSNKRKNRILRTVIYMTIAHIIFTLPNCLQFIIKNAIHEENGEEEKENPYSDFISILMDTIQLCNHLIHFYIYSLTSSIFMEDLKKLFPILFKTRVPCCQKRQSPEDVEGTESSNRLQRE